VAPCRLTPRSGFIGTSPTAVRIVTLQDMNSDGPSWWQENLSLLIGSLSAAAIAVRLLVVSRGDPETAFAILQASGTGAVLVGTLVSVVGLAAAPIGLLFFFYARRPQEAVLKTILYGAAAASFYIALFTAQALELLAGIVIIILVRVLCAKSSQMRERALKSLGAGQTASAAASPSDDESSRYSQAASKNDSQPETLRKSLVPAWASIAIVIYLLFTLGAQTFSPKPWLPIEAITMHNGQKFSGYVLSDTNGMIYILTASPTGVIHVPITTILDTKNCSPGLSLSMQVTLAEIFETPYRMSYGTCPSTRFNASGPDGG
jgi:hypothetical protein